MQNFGGANKVHYGRCASDESSYLDQTSLVNKVFILLPSYHGFHSQRFVLLLFSILRVGRPPRPWFISFSRLPFPASFASTLNVPMVFLISFARNPTSNKLLKQLTKETIWNFRDRSCYLKQCCRLLTPVLQPILYSVLLSNSIGFTLH